MAEHQAPTALSDDDLAAVTGGKGAPGTGSLPAAPDGANILEIMMAVQQERMAKLEEQINSKAAEVRADSQTYSDLNQGLSVLRNAEKGLEGQGPDAQVSLKSLAADWGNRSVEEFTRALGLPADAVQDGRLGKGELQSAIAGVSTRIDAVNAEGQLDMVQLQGLMDRRNQAVEVMNNLLSKAGKSLPPPGDRG